MAANAVNATVVGIVLPLSMFVLMERLFEGSARRIGAGAARSCRLGVRDVSVGLLTFGPLYDLLSYAILPVVAVLFMGIFDHCVEVRVRIVRSLLFVVGIVLLASLRSQRRLFRRGASRAVLRRAGRPRGTFFLLVAC